MNVSIIYIFSLTNTLAPFLKITRNVHRNETVEIAEQEVADCVIYFIFYSPETDSEN